MKNFDIKNIDIKKAVKIGGIILVILIGGMIYLFQDEGGEEIAIVGSSETNAEEQLNSDGKGATESEEKQDIILHIAGAVNSPKVVMLKEGSRVFEAIDEAGGLKDNADSQNLNMAAKLKDGDKLYIPFEGEFAEDKKLNQGNLNVVTDMKNKGYMAETESILGVSSAPSSSADQLININTATSEQLQTLTGVGPSTAEKILTYRNTQGEFKNIEDLKNVSGIGDKTFQKFMDKICTE